MDPFIESQFKWMKTFEACKNLNNLSELCDGIQIAMILKQISPSHFTDEWFDKLKQNPENWRLRISNLKKILDKVSDYYDNLMPSYPNIKLPDLNKIGKDNDHNELARLLQLVLGIAVNCEQKHQYIGNITKLDLSIQQNLMEAIQQLMSNSHSANNQQLTTIDYLNTNGQTANHVNNFIDSLNLNESNFLLQEQFLRAMENLRDANEEKKAILEQSHELNKKLIAEQNEKFALQNEYEKLLDKYKSLNARQEEMDLEETDISKNKHVIKLNKTIDQLKKEIEFLENQKEENSIKLELVENEVIKLKLQNENLQRKAKETQFLRDELDEHKHTSDKILSYEQKLDKYQKKFEEFTNLEREYNLIEKKNRELIAKNLELEEELKKPSILKQQIQDYRKKNKELQQEVDEKTKNCYKLEFDLERQTEKLNCLNQERLIFEKENNELKSKLKQLDKNSLSQLNIKDEVDSLQMLNGDQENQNQENQNQTKLRMNNCLDFEINEFSVDLKDKLIRIELENKLLKSRLEETNQEAVLLLRTSYEDAKTRVTELEKDNRQLNRAIAELESKLNDMNLIDFNISNSSNQSTALVPTNQFAKLKELEDQLRSKMKIISLYNNQIYDLEQKIRKLEGQLSKKDDEFNEISAKYKKYVLKAKQAVSFLEPISIHLNSLSSISPSNSSVNSICNNGHLMNGQLNSNQINNQNGQFTVEDIYSTNNIELLKQALADKDKKINEMIINNERERNLKEIEQRLITSAFHNLSFSLHRRVATERILQATNQQSIENNMPMSNSSGSLLSKQRLPTVRRLI